MNSRAVLCGVMLLVLVGCQTTVKGPSYPLASSNIYEQLKTKEDVVNRFGIPAQVRDEGDHVVWNYRAFTDVGIYAGVAAYGIQLIGAHHHRVQDGLMVHFDKSNQVVSVTPLIAHQISQRRWWPGGH